MCLCVEKIFDPAHFCQPRLLSNKVVFETNEASGIMQVTILVLFYSVRIYDFYYKLYSYKYYVFFPC